MYKTIYKYILKETDYQSLELPKGYEILTIQLQNEVPCLWALINPNSIEKEVINIEMVGTGHYITYNTLSDRKYISTIQFKNGLVFHLFEYTGL